MVRETVVTPDNLIWPLFVNANLTGTGDSARTAVPGMPGVAQTSEDELVRDVARGLELGLRSVILFGIPKTKDARGSEAWDDEHGVIPRAIRALKTRFGDDLVVITDVCFCQYTDHGHCGVLTERGLLDNDATLENIARQTIAHAAAGADIVAPSGMIDGTVDVMRQALEEDGFKDTIIMAYAAKFASAFYGPFREAAHSAPSTATAADGAPVPSDRKAYQMDPANWREAQREIELDDLEGADILMVKPALAYLDVIAKARDDFHKPIAAYNVSGEYAMLHAAAATGAINADAAMLETLTAIRRAGANLVLTYHAPRFAELYRERA